MSDIDLKKLLQRVIELVMPNLRHYYRVPRKGRIVKSYPSDGSYYADVQPLRNDESDDSAEPMLPRVEIPVVWAGPNRGLICPPAVGTLCDITYYDGDPNYPRISNFRWAKGSAPVCELGALVLQQGEAAFFTIKGNGEMLAKTALFTIDGRLHSTGNISSDGEVSDSVRSMSEDRGIYNGHRHWVENHPDFSNPPRVQDAQ